MTSLRIIWDLDCVKFVTETQLAGTVSVCLDEEFHGKWEALSMKFQKADDTEKEEMLARDYLNLNDSSVCATTAPTNSRVTSFIHKQKLCDGWVNESYAMDLGAYRHTMVPVDKQFPLLVLFMHSASMLLEETRIKGVRTSQAIKRATNQDPKDTKKTAPVNNIVEDVTADLEGNVINNIGGINNIPAKKRKTLPCPLKCDNEKCKEGLPGPGSTYFCVTMTGAKPQVRYKYVCDTPLCGRCLQNGDPATGGHLQADCKSTHRCRVCRQDHNTLLHDVLGQGGKKEETTNNIEDYDDIIEDGAGFTDELIDSINNVIDVGMDGEEIYEHDQWINTIKADPRSLELFLELVSKIKPTPKQLKCDSWSEDEKKVYTAAVENLKRAILDSRRAAAEQVKSSGKVDTRSSYYSFNPYV